MVLEGAFATVWADDGIEAVPGREVEDISGVGTVGATDALRTPGGRWAEIGEERIEFFRDSFCPGPVAQTFSHHPINMNTTSVETVVVVGTILEIMGWLLWDRSRDNFH